jgi:hypothetical protein
VSGTLSFAPGDRVKTVSVPIIGDSLDEVDETVLLTLSSSSGPPIIRGQGTGMIDDDDGPTITSTSPSTAEGDSGTHNLTFTVTLSAPSPQQVSVLYETDSNNDTAVAGADYTAVQNRLIFAPGETTKTIDVPVLGDTLDEQIEYFALNLFAPVDATVGTAQPFGFINDDDGPVVSIGDITVAEGDSGSTAATFTVSLDRPSVQTVSVSYATADQTATAASDYAPASGTVSFNTGETSKTITVNVAGDAIDETNETFAVNLTSPSNASIGDGQGIGTIIDDDGPPALSIGDVTILEGNAGQANAVFTVSLLPVAGQTVTVDYATADGSAAGGTDFVAASGTLTFLAGDSSKTITVPVTGDTLDEDDETFTVNLTNAANATIADPQGQGTITDDDGPAISISNVTVTEGNGGIVNATFDVTLSAPSLQTVTVDFATANGTASAGSDYNTQAGTLTFDPAQTAQTITVAVTGDLVDESNETFAVNLTNAVNATIAVAQGAGTITDDDTATLSIADTNAPE